MIKRKIYYKIPDEDKNTLFEKTDTKLGLIANYTIIFFIFLSVILVGIETLPNINNEQKFIIFIIDLIISIVFLFEYIYRFINSDNKIKFPFRFINIMDLLSFLPFFLLIIFYGIGSYGFFALFRVFRIFRIYELIERVPIAKKLFKGIYKHRIEYLSAIFVIIIVLTLFSSTVYFAEQFWGDKNGYNSIPKTFWWAIVTMTTTGYGDMVPASFIGKTIASLLMFLGPVLITIISSITVIIFLDSTKLIELNYNKKICPKCNKSNPNNSIYCNKCGKKM
ncbi:MAG: ion transporter [Candidatus Gracilibacteria bacterium]|nr:ion transporter [Candidatus Gracilibacteria bacterium]